MLTASFSLRPGLRRQRRSRARSRHSREIAPHPNPTRQRGRTAPRACDAAGDTGATPVGCHCLRQCDLRRDLPMNCVHANNEASAKCQCPAAEAGDFSRTATIHETKSLRCELRQRGIGTSSTTGGWQRADALRRSFWVHTAGGSATSATRSPKRANGVEWHPWRMLFRSLLYRSNAESVSCRDWQQVVLLMGAGS